MSTVRWGIVGTGAIADAVAGDFQFVPGGDLVAVASRSQAHADAFADKHRVPIAYGDYRSLIESPDVDVVYIATPHPQHTDIALAAIAAGKALLVEKAFTATVADTERIADAARAAGVFVMEAMWTRYLPHMVRVRRSSRPAPWARCAPSSPTTPSGSPTIPRTG